MILQKYYQKKKKRKKGSLMEKSGIQPEEIFHLLKADGIKDDVRKCEKFESLFDGDWYDHVLCISVDSEGSNESTKIVAIA